MKCLLDTCVISELVKKEPYSSVIRQNSLIPGKISRTDNEKTE